MDLPGHYKGFQRQMRDGSPIRTWQGKVSGAGIGIVLQRQSAGHVPRKPQGKPCEGGIMTVSVRHNPMRRFDKVPKDIAADDGDTTGRCHGFKPCLPCNGCGKAMTFRRMYQRIPLGQGRPRALAPPPGARLLDGYMPGFQRLLLLRRQPRGIIPACRKDKTT